jgi:hypothetical protein
MKVPGSLIVGTIHVVNFLTLSYQVRNLGLACVRICEEDREFTLTVT